ncbi:hypothetical protein F444_16625, partial [Phytophthora nicotianae P1976]
QESPAYIIPVPTLPRGSYLLLFPEDVDGVIDTPAYAKGTTPGYLDQTSGVCVCVKNDGFFRYDQVTGYSDSRLTISTLSGPIEENPDVICDTVYPVVALVMGCHQFEESSWDYEELTRIHDILMERLLSPPTSEVPQTASPLAELMQGLLPDVFPGFDRMAKWIDSHTGVCTQVSVQHVVNYVYFVDGGKSAPSHVKASLGTSFCDSVVASRKTENAPSSQNVAQTNTSNASGFFDILRVDDEGEAAHEEALVANTVLSGTLPTVILDTSPASTSNAGPLTEAPTAEEEIRALIRMHKPHLLQYHLTAQPNPDSSLKRTATVDIDNSAAKRSKFSFHPSAEQRRVHDAVTADAHRGMPPSEFVESLVSSCDLWAYPGVATRAYDLEFGSRGLSFLHFTPVDQMLRVRRQHDSFINMSDFSVSAKFLAAPDPSSWEDVLAGANGFQHYRFTRCDTVTQHLGTALYSLVVELKARKLWPQDMLLTLVLWIDAQLERYRSAVVRDITAAPSTRCVIVGQFTPNNVELHGLFLAEQRNQFDAIRQSAANRSPQTSNTSRQTRSQRNTTDKPRREQSDNYSPLPQQDGKEVCLKFLSRNVARPAIPTCASLPAERTSTQRSSPTNCAIIFEESLAGSTATTSEEVQEPMVLRSSDMSAWTIRR